MHRYAGASFISELRSEASLVQPSSEIDGCLGTGSTGLSEDDCAFG